jgi:hypothetical protein
MPDGAGAGGVEVPDAAIIGPIHARNEAAELGIRATELAAAARRLGDKLNAILDQVPDEEWSAPAELRVVPEGDTA